MKKISVMQYSAMIFLLPITMFFGVGLSNISIHSKESFWISIIIGVILGSFIVHGFSKIMEKNSNSLIENASKKKTFIYILISLVFIFFLYTQGPNLNLKYF